MNRFDVELFSNRFSVRRMQKEDIPLIYAMTSTNTLYYEYCGRQNTAEDIAQDLCVTPPGKELGDKYYVGFFDGPVLAAVMDLIDGYPSDDTAFIGFFMMNAAYQGTGLGTAMIGEICAYLKQTGIAYVQLGYEKMNPQSSHFWKKNGFDPVKEISMEAGIIVKAEKGLI